MNLRVPKEGEEFLDYVSYYQLLKRTLFHAVFGHG
jgi:hypothetical protein